MIFFITRNHFQRFASAQSAAFSGAIELRNLLHDVDGNPHLEREAFIQDVGQVSTQPNGPNPIGNK